MSDEAPHRAPTIYDVAKAAGVAASTVSRTFARPGRVNAATAERIRQTAAELGYRVNPIAQALPTGRTSMIAVVVSDLANPFHNEILRGAQSAVAEAGYTMLLADAQESGSREREVLERTMSTVEGIVLATSRMPDSAIRMIAKQRPTVVLNRTLADVPSVVTDNPRGMRRAAEHLGELGHERITYVAGPEASWADGTRWRALREAGLALELQVRRIGPYEPTVAGGARAAAELLKHPTSAVIAYNDMMAIGLIRALTTDGVRIPQDVSVIGFDNIFAADLVTPALTTVAAPLAAMGTTAVRNLLAMIRGARLQTAEPVSLPSRLVVRASTAHRRRNRTSPAWGTTKAPGAEVSTAAGSR
ncbi:LacI family DNA-binding transcriptional regulator [Actinoplanes derwentensis]|uniref:Transcriptional regulator, LacI family n=1 Tax=Actinoplanes derwentensis TaxID=113562 RepID=A0A1H1XH94_9ACTN|nr:LacI family DNA-binding transcriptional regulator [Actinoplanes derwentensis]GID87185.1 LacI family transcriptional regulator [Actinoplanes derwentensis]SDT08560.1 transcriptional regulator, LacI family [Actinoplanes derwentensis]